MVHRVAASIAAVDDDFDVDGFTTRALDGFADLELTPRCRQIATAMAEYLPDDPRRAIGIVVESLGPELENCDPADAAPTGDPEIDDNPMSGFFYLPHGYFVAGCGVEHFDEVMRANYEITKRATSEFSIRTPLPRQHRGDARRVDHLGDRPERPCATAGLGGHSTSTAVVVSPQGVPGRPCAGDRVARVAQGRPGQIRQAFGGEQPERHREGSSGRGRRGGSALVGRCRRSSPTADPSRTAHPDQGGRLRCARCRRIRIAFTAEVRAGSIEPAEVAIGGAVTIEVAVENPSVKVCGALVDLRVHFVTESAVQSEGLQGRRTPARTWL